MLLKNLDPLLQDCLDRIARGEDLESALARHPQAAQELRPQLELALRLRASQAALQPRPGFVAASQAHLLEQIRRGERPHLAPFWRRRLVIFQPTRTFNLVTLALALVCLVAIGNSVFLATRLALPGELLYPAKLSLEQAQLALTFSQAGDTRLHIEFSQRRASEVAELILDDRYADAPYAVRLLGQQVSAGLASLDAVAADDPAQAEALRAAFQQSLANEQLLFSVLLRTYPPNARPMLELALDVTSYGLEALHE